MNKKKNFNDPVHGFLSIHSDLILDIINHPVFQRLRRIKQLGLTEFVYPGALHTRFHHALGAMHLMSIALDSLRGKGHEISEKEYESALIAILLHDVGHSPFSHALEHSILEGIAHEKMSLQLMQYLNQVFDNQLDMAIAMFSNQYHRRFFYQLVSSQLDMDRLDYLQRDSFFTGVVEGTVGADRIIRMLELRNDEIVVEEKAIYSIESFLNARRLMYWQVYLHKTTVAAEQMLIHLIKRAKFLSQSGIFVPATPALQYFLTPPPAPPLLGGEFLTSSMSGSPLPEGEGKGVGSFSPLPFGEGQGVGLVGLGLQHFIQLDDYDIWGAIKMWTSHSDKVLQLLSNMLLKRQLFKAKIENEKFDNAEIITLRKQVKSDLDLDNEEIKYFVLYGALTNSAYISGNQKINMLKKSGEIIDIAQAADLPNIKAMSKIVKKYYLCTASGK